MPIKSKAQQRLMYAAAQDPEVAKKTGVSQKVAREFIKSTPKKRFKKLKEKLGCSKCSGE
jgi:cytochrome c-type biogenesis protein CcmH/NrfF